MVYQLPSITSVKITSPFFLQFDHLMRQKTIPAIIASMRSTGRADALTWTAETARIKPHPFWDSDMYKAVEACCYYLMNREEPAMRAFVDEMVGNIKGAVWKDGYINSYYTVNAPDKRFTNLRDMHELYQLGHLAEAAAGYYLLTGSHDLISVVRGMLELVRKTVFPRGGYPGHQEIEIGLLRLYEITGDEIFRESVGYFLRERGKADEKGESYYDREAFERGGDPYDHLGSEYRGWFRKPRDYAYMQAHVPLVEQKTIEGHSVRAMYWVTGAQMYALCTPDDSAEVQESVRRLFDNTVNRKMYITGGLGGVERIEGFGPEHYLPDHAEGGCCYSETCASFALIMLCSRLLQGELKGVYGDVMERAFLNVILGSVGTDGESFYYENHLATLAGHAHARSRWFDVACCPPNIARLLGYLPALVFSQQQSTIAIHLFLASTYTTEIHGEAVTVKMETNLPWNGAVTLTVQSKQPVTLAVRVPFWAVDGYTSSTEGEIKNIYLYITTKSSDTTVIDLHFPTEPRLVYAHPATREDGEVAVMRGPLVYCAEGVDNDFNLELTYVSSDSLHEVGNQAIAGIKDVPILQLRGRVKNQTASGNDLYSYKAPMWEQGDKEVTLVPYFLRMNRGGNGALRTWLRELAVVGSA